jgi:hypothetical protein
MNSLDAAVEVCHLGLNVILLWLTWHYLWRRACQERLRQNLFDLRDELFDFARSGEITFQEPAYVLLRGRINSMIRFSHRLGVTRLFTFICFQRYIGEIPNDRNAARALKSALSQVKGREVKAVLDGFSARLEEQIVKHILYASPHVILVAPVLLFLNHVISKDHHVRGAAHEAPKPSIRVIEAHAREVGIRIIEAQAREAFVSEAFGRNREVRQEPASV